MAGGFASIENLVAQKVEETHTLEFKQKQNQKDLDLHKDDRRALGEALSGFANATGGTLVIGVRTDRPNGLDRAAELKPIDNVAAAGDRYRAYINDCIAPPIDGVRVACLETASGEGVILVHVPTGNARPHMSMAPGHQRYYRRVADGFVPMLHYEIDEMMRLKSQPVLEFIHSLAQTGSMGSNRNFHILFGLKNTSRMTAKFPFVSYLQEANQPSVAEFGLDGNGRTLWTKVAPGASPAVTFAAGADQVLHPGQAFYVSKIDFCEIFEPRHRRDWGISNLADGERLTLKFEFGCEDCPTQIEEISFSKTDLLNAR